MMNELDIEWQKSEERREGMEQGRQEGRQEKTLEIAKKLLLLGLSDEQICSATGLSVEQVQKLS